MYMLSFMPEYHGDVIISSAVRLSRNIDKIPFPVRLNVSERDAVNKKVYEVLVAAGLPVNVTDMSKLYPYEAVALAERGIISPEFASSSGGRILISSEDCSISIMLNEDDHIRITAFASSLQPEKAYESASVYEKALDGKLRLAFDPELGFLTQNPKNLGTGLRVSAVMHLPALSRNGTVSSLVSTVSKLGMSFRGAFGDSLSVRGDMYRLSNNITLGIDEKTAVSNLKSMALQIATKEHACAENLIKDIGIRDKINRAQGLLSTAMLVDNDEMPEMLSLLRLGAVYGICSVDVGAVNELMYTLQPACLNCIAGGRLSVREQDELRAKIIRKKLFGAE